MNGPYRKTLIATAIAMLAGAAGATGQNPAPSFEEADRNRDGSLSFAEVTRVLPIEREQFAAADADGNGSLSRQEYAGAGQTGQQGRDARMSGQAAAGAQAAMPGAQIQVEEQPSKIEVTQPEPKITVQQPAPDIKIQQPKPIVNVQTPEPRVVVKEAQPQVRVVERGEPQVEVTQSGKVDATVTQAKDDEQTPAAQEPAERERITQSDASGQQPAGSAMGALTAKRVGEIKGMSVENRTGEEIGEVDKVVKEGASGKLYAVVSVGGFLGIGDKQIPMALDGMQLQDDKLIAPTAKDEDRLEDRAAYVAENYQELDDAQMLGEAGEFSAFERQPAN